MHAELGKGDYTFIVVAKLPGVSRDTERLALNFYEYQLYAVASKNLPNKVKKPASMNLLGVLGLKGENFGQVVRMVPHTKLGPTEHIEFEFTLAEGS